MHRHNAGNDPLKLCLLLSVALLLGMGKAQEAFVGQSEARTNATLSDAPPPGLLEFLTTFDVGNARFADPAMLEAFAPEPLKRHAQ
ncbi:MAG: hypothetical protein CVU60_04680 [Deltaproteobacteria bacterium HGW-Deltaproteobacteria-18]|jgi:hypothetical protein|nr:MAG: hypothetical protein CVU60_04680 [Deltaproteobacteria bacterium HGW-Deltaproteobacteria-18]